MRSIIRRRKREYTRSVIVADAVGVTHYVATNLILIIGEFTDIFVPLAGGAKHPGIVVVTDYIDSPIARFLKPYFSKYGSDPLSVHLLAELVIVGSSIVYGTLAYVVCRVLGVAFSGPKK